MAGVARAAGGDVFVISGTPAAALNQIETELASYYLLSFESDPSDGGKRRNCFLRRACDLLVPPERGVE